MNTYKETKNRLLTLLEEKSLSIYELSMRSGVSPSTIKNILYGKSKNPGIVTIKLMCDGFGISIADFFNSVPFRQLEPED